MARLPWTKFQDFYLRSGFLKVLVVAMDPHRRSAAKELLVRRLEDVLFGPARDHNELWRELNDRFPWAASTFQESGSAKHASDRSRPTITEALLLMGDCPSQLYAITRKTAYKILDWGRNLQLMGAGNQISEKGLVLRAMLPTDACARFLQGDPLAWNPFVLTPHERLFFLFHLCEVDHLTVEVLDELARRGGTEPIETGQASEITCRAFFQVLDRAADRVSSADLPALRRARELASVMAHELKLDDLAPKLSLSTRERVPKALRIKARPGPWRAKSQARRTTKNADHQTIPRFEQLVDLGFARKPCHEADGPVLWRCRRHWRFERLPTCDGWLVERNLTREGQGPWEWRGFAAAALGSGIAGVPRRSGDPDSNTVAEFLWRAYLKVRRQVGHTPFHSVAMVAMIEATTSGFAIEMRRFHELLLALKKHALLQDSVFFASGNEIDRMFVVIRESFAENIRQLSPELLVLPR